MLIACYNVYNEAKHLPESVASVYDHVGKLVFVDGRYEGFYEDKPVASTDGTLAWVKDKGNDPDGKFHLIKAPKKPWKNQAEKRSAYLIGEDGDTYLYIDGHEVVTEWRVLNMMLGEIGFARLDIPDDDPPISVKAPRLIAHKEGLKYHTHTYLVHGKNEDFYANLGWDQQTLGDIDGFWQRAAVETCSLTIRHIGTQKKKAVQRQEQVIEERQKVEVFDHEKGLNFKADSHKAVERLTARLHPTWVRDAQIRGMAPPTYEESSRIVAAYARDWWKKQRILRQKNTYLKTKVVCDHCGWIATNMSSLVDHIQAEHKRKVV
jgi:hypothetical protein